MSGSSTNHKILLVWELEYRVIYRKMMISSYPHISKLCDYFTWIACTWQFRYISIYCTDPLKWTRSSTILIRYDDCQKLSRRASRLIPNSLSVTFHVKWTHSWLIIYLALIGRSQIISLNASLVCFLSWRQYYGRVGFLACNRENLSTTKCMWYDCFGNLVYDHRKDQIIIAQTQDV